MAHGRIYRYIFIETRPKFRFLIILAIVLVCILEIITFSYVKEKIKDGEERKALITRIPEMESFLYPDASRPTLISQEIVEPIKIGGHKYLLKGVQELNGKLSALINEDVYQEGDMIAGYRITKITTTSVLFKNDKTNNTKILRLGN